MVSTEPQFFRSTLPAGKAGQWVVEKFELQLEDRKDDRPHWARSESGHYTRLMKGSEVYMTDLYDEWWTQKQAIENALCLGGEVLISGLGIGMVVEAMLSPAKSPVQRIVVVEKSFEVIQLSAQYLIDKFGSRVEIIHDDIFDYEPDTHFSVVWHDIWPNPCASTVENDIKRLRQRFDAYCDWQGFWGQEYRDEL